MIASVGIDIVDVTRIEQALRRFGDKFVQRILSPGECTTFVERCSQAAFLAGRFAAKEAAIKALGRYLTVRPSFHDVEIITNRYGQPAYQFAETITRQMHAHAHVSISHERTMAIAVAVFEEIV